MPHSTPGAPPNHMKSLQYLDLFLSSLFQPSPLFWKESFNELWEKGQIYLTLICLVRVESMQLEKNIFQHYIYFIPRTSCLLDFWEVRCYSLLPPTGKVFFLWLLSRFFLYLWFLLFEYKMPRHSFKGAFILLGVPWASWIYVCCLTLSWGKFSVIIASNIASIPFFLLLLLLPYFTLYLLQLSHCF